MNVALEKGLGVEKVKLGGDNKTPGYAVRTGTLRKVVTGVVCLAMVLMGASALSYSAAIRERYNAYLATRSHENTRLKGSALSIAQNMQLDAALSTQETMRDDVIRILKRIRGYAAKRVEDTKQLIGKENPKLSIQAADLLSEIETFIDSERTDFEREFEKQNGKVRVQLDVLRKRQTEALKKLLMRVTDVRLGALEDILEDLFERLKETVEISLPESLWEPLENLADKLYQEELSFTDGVRKFDEDFRPYFSYPGLPREITDKLASPRSPGELADTLDEILEGVQLYKGRAELESIQRAWLSAQSQVENSQGRQKDKAEAEYGRATVDAVLDVQELINKEILPQDFLDFDLLSLDESDDDDDDDDDDENENGGGGDAGDEDDDEEGSRVSGNRRASTL